MRKQMHFWAVRLMTLALFSILIAGCYNDDELWDEVKGIKTELSQLKENLSNLQTIVSAYENAKFITNYEETDEGIKITFSDNKTIIVKHGEKGADAPVVSVKEEDGIFYWAITTNGETDFLLVNGQKLRVTGNDGVTPQLSIDADGYWMVNGTRIQDASGKEVKAEGTDGDSFFEDITASDTEVTFKMTGGTSFTIPTTKGVNIFSFVAPTDGHTFYSFYFNEKKNLVLNMDKITAVDFLKKPTGWKFTFNESNKTLTVEAPNVGTAYEDGIVTLIGIHENGSTMFASIALRVIDFTDYRGTFVVCEGNMSSANGTIYFYDKYGTEYSNVFENANDGMEIGNVVQDMYMANDKIYIITQNGSGQGGAGRFVVCDAHTFKMEYADPLVIMTPEGKSTWPQHLVVVSPTRAYVQYSESGMEATSGIAALTLSDGAVKVEPTVDGSFGAFTVAGATKGRMVYSRGKVYAGCGQKVIIIDPATDQIIKSIPFEGHQIKGIAKGADGNIYCPLAATYTGSLYSPTFTSSPKMVALDHDGNVLSETDMPDEIELPIASWSPSVGFCASFTQPNLYFVDTDAFNATSASRYNYTTQSFDVNFLNTSITIYGIMGIHPTTEEYWVGQSTYVNSDIYVYDISSGTPTEKSHFKYNSQRGASPAGIDFVYRFSDEWINK